MQSGRIINNPCKTLTTLTKTINVKTKNMKLFDVCTRKFYEKDGEKKVKWYRAGIMKETDKGSRYLRLFSNPETDFFIFEKTENPENKEN